MDGKKKLSAARQKLQEYKMSKGIRTGGTTFTEVNETGPNRPSVVDNLLGSEPPTHHNPFLVPPPPPMESIQTYMNNLSQTLLTSGNTNNDTKVLNVNPSSFNAGVEVTTAPSPSSEVDMSMISTFPGIDAHQECPTPTAPTFDQTFEDQTRNHQKFTDEGQNFPVNFFQSTPIAHPATQKSPYEQQNFFHQPNQSTTQPLFYNVSGATITPMPPPPYSEDMINTNMVNIDPELALIPDTSKKLANVSAEDANLQIVSEPQMLVLTNGGNTNEESSQRVAVSSSHSKNVKFNLDHLENVQTDPENPLPEAQVPRKFPTPTLRRVSTSSEEEKERQEIQAFQRMKSFQDALELQLDELRRDNERLLNRQSELVLQLEDNEKTVQELRRERDRCKEEAKKPMQQLNIKINNLFEENQRILKNSNDVGMELRSKLQEKTKQQEEMEQAFIIVSNAKMDLAASLDQEKEKNKELETVVQNQNKELNELRSTVGKLEEKLKLEQQKDVIIHQLEDQIRHFQVQSGTFERELRRANNKIERLSLTNAGEFVQRSSEHGTTEEVNASQPHQHHHEHVENCSHGSHTHEEHGHNHSHDDHDHSDGHDHSHDHSHHEDQPSDLPQRNEELEMKKRLHHLEWENSTFRSDLDKLATEAREKRSLEEKFNKVSEECEKFKCECQRLELLVVQLQGENDTIGDYITLYQSQKLALKESAREKELQLAKEREALLKKIEELTQLLKLFKHPATENICNTTTEQAHHQCSHSNPSISNDSSQKDEIEGKIRHLLSEISSSSLIENFHPCAVCSGRLMNV